MVATVDRADGSVSDRTERARLDGSAVLVVAARDAEDGTGGMLLPGSDSERTAVDFDDAIDALRDLSDRAHYTGMALMTAAEPWCANVSS